MAMDSNSSVFGGMFGGNYGSKDPSMNVGLNSNPAMSQLSPYLSVDPAWLRAQDEFIPLENNEQRRGRMELAFSQIGGLTMLGGAVGGCQGLYKGLLDTKHISGPIRRTQLINYVSKRVSGTANTLGTVAVMYSALGCLFYYGRGKQEDSINSLAAGAVTGALYQSPSGLRRAGIGGLVGLAFAAGIVAFHSLDKSDNRLNSSMYF